MSSENVRKERGKVKSARILTSRWGGAILRYKKNEGKGTGETRAVHLQCQWLQIQRAVDYLEHVVVWQQKAAQGRPGGCVRSWGDGSEPASRRMLGRWSGASWWHTVAPASHCAGGRLINIFHKRTLLKWRTDLFWVVNVLGCWSTLNLRINHSSKLTYIHN